MTTFTKSLFLAGMQCPLRLWLLVYKPELIPPLGKAEQFRMRTGTEVGKLARQLFPGGKMISNSSSYLANASSETPNAMENQSTPSLFEAPFSFEDMIVKVDILQRQQNESWSLWEVKSSTRLKDDHLYDVWFQKRVLENSGMMIEKYGLCLMNRDYVYDGESLDLSSLFVLEDVTSQINQLDEELCQKLESFRSVISSDNPPNIEMSKHCKDCEYFGHCSIDKPKFWIYYLPRISKKKWDMLTASGIDDICKIPLDFELTSSQEIIRDATRDNAEYISADIANSMQNIEYPLYFLDFESCNEAIPRYFKCTPFQQIPFQWSCHILSEDGALKHCEFLHDQNSDPRPAFIDSLLACLNNKGTILHYTAFEKTRLTELASAYPEHEQAINKVIERLYDLCKVLRDNYYHPEFRGSYSIKDVLPVVASELSYSELDIQDGTLAAIKYLEMIHPDTEPEIRRDIRDSLLEYCKLDTLAMTKVWEFLINK